MNTKETIFVIAMLLTVVGGIRLGIQDIPKQLRTSVVLGSAGALGTVVFFVFGPNSGDIYLMWVMLSLASDLLLIFSFLTYMSGNQKIKEEALLLEWKKNKKA
jgi:hypothetical protein